MQTQNPRASCGFVAQQFAGGPRRAPVFLHRPRHECRQPGGYALARQVTRHLAQAVGVRIVDIHAQRAVDVQINKPGPERQTVKIERVHLVRRILPVGENPPDAPVGNEQRRAFQHAVGRDDVCAAQQ